MENTQTAVVGRHPDARGEPAWCPPVAPLAVFGDVGVYIEHGGEILDCLADGGDGAGSTGVAEHGVLFSVSVDTGFQNRTKGRDISISFASI